MIRYKSIKKTETGKKYEVIETKVWPLGIRFLGFKIKTDFMSLIDATLTANKGFQWDGASGAFDSPDFMEASAAHDCLCNMMEAGLMPKRMWKHAANEMRIINKREKMPWIRRQWTWAAVRFYGKIKPWH